MIQSPGHEPFETVEFQVKNGKIVLCAKKDLVLVPIAKVEIYAMGKVTMHPQHEFRQLLQMKQTARKEFDKNTENEQRLSHIRKLKHNYERSQAMFEVIKQLGMTDSVEDVNKLISHLLDIGDRVTIETSVHHPSYLEVPNGKLRVLSTWVILPDNTKYLSTFRFIPRKVET